MSYINRKKKFVVEGELRCTELVEYLEKMNAPKRVWISEDAFGVVQRISYHSPTGQLVGLVLPVDPMTGMPIPSSFIPHTADDIAEQMKGPKASMVYIIMAQPIKEGVPPFVLQVFGSDNCFTTEIMLKRWNHTKDELAK